MKAFTLEELANKIYNLSNSIREINGYPIEFSMKDIRNFIRGLNINDNLYINNRDGSVQTEEPYIMGCYIRVHVKTLDINKYACQIQ